MISQFDWLARESSTEAVDLTVKLKKTEKGFGVHFDDDRFIRKIERGSDAHNSKLRVGDKIVCINGYQCRTATEVKEMAACETSLIFSVKMSEK